MKKIKIITYVSQNTFSEIKKDKEKTEKNTSKRTSISTTTASWLGQYAKEKNKRCAPIALEQTEILKEILNTLQKLDTPLTNQKILEEKLEELLFQRTLSAHLHFLIETPTKNNIDTKTTQKEHLIQDIAETLNH